MRILRLLWAAGPQLPHHEIVFVLQMSRVTVSGLVRRLGRDGASPIDRRLPGLSQRSHLFHHQWPDGRESSARLLASRVDVVFKDLSARDLESILRCSSAFVNAHPESGIMRRFVSNA